MRRGGARAGEVTWGRDTRPAALITDGWIVPVLEKLVERGREKNAAPSMVLISWHFLPFIARLIRWPA